MVDNKPEYRALCQAKGSAIPLFQQAWWWDAATVGKRWEVLLHRSGGQVVAALPYQVGSKLGLRYSMQPLLTLFGGPWVDQASGSPETETLHSLIDQLHRRHLLFFSQNLEPGSIAATAFAAQGYKVRERCTYRIDDIGNPDDVFARFHPSQRQRPIRSAESQLTVGTGMTAAEMAQFHAETLTARGRRDLLPPALIESVVQAALDHSQGLLLDATDRDGRRMGALFVAFDDSVAYALLLPRRPDAPSGTIPLLVWHAIRTLSGHCRAFDFDGGNQPNLGHYYSLFGSRRVSMACVYRYC
ncbi:MAG: GNAT family N-acetyltransferase [Bacteroidales bacterium]|nr:GNAT family N-acetyltransferase [Bacteroidales bacterium]